jgi:hypothetical protein
VVGGWRTHAAVWHVCGHGTREEHYEPPRHQGSPAPRKLANHRLGLLADFNGALIKRRVSHFRNSAAFRSLALINM